MIDLDHHTAFVARCRALREVATKGRWYWDGQQWDTPYVHQGHVRTDVPINQMGFNAVVNFGIAREKDLDFICATPTILEEAERRIAALVAEVRAAQAVVEAAQQAYALWLPHNDPTIAPTELVEAAGKALKRSLTAYRAQRPQGGEGGAGRAVGLNRGSRPSDV